MKKFILLLASAFILSSCMKSVSISTMRPAEINIPSSVQSIVLVDRTKYEKEGLAILEGVLTGEGINEDKDGVIALFSALQDNLRNSPRYIIKQEPRTLLGNSLTGAFPEPLSWRIIDDLGRKHEADAVLAVEVFDSDFILTNGKRQKTRTVETKEGKKVEEEYTEFFAEGVGNVRIGIRLYNIAERSIEDQDIFTQSRTWETSATSLREAMAKMVAKSQATRYLGAAVGSSYAGKIAPMPVYLSRSYYAKPKNNSFISKGARQAEVNQWEEAISTWKAGIQNSSETDTKGRLAYNIALGYEVLGDFQLAKDWASKAYVDYGEKKGQSYASQLEYRMQQEALVDEQLRMPEQTQDQTPNNNSYDLNAPIKLKPKD